MKIPISERLLCCASLVPVGARVADIGADHGYLGIHLLREGIAQTVYACDLREKPLQRARENAARFGVEAQMHFLRTDGLRGVPQDAVDTVVCAGMGGDLIVSILERAPWLRKADYRLILQPQTGGQHLRRYLSERNFALVQEKLVLDNGFLYTVLEARYGCGAAFTPGQEYVSPQLLAENSQLLPAYMERIATALRETVRGLRSSEKLEVREKLAYYEAALSEITEMREQL